MSSKKWMYITRTFTVDSIDFSKIPPFYISYNRVTVSEFTEFVQSTGYVTTAEQRQHPFSYKYNPRLTEIPTDTIPHQPAYCVSYDDAIHYCKWANCRLPTEHEWLAAALCTPLRAERSDCELEIATILESLYVCIHNINHEYTSDMVNNLHVVRRGPYLLPPSKISIIDPRFTINVTSTYFYMMSFRVCKL
jgi:hypothetical protein